MWKESSCNWESEDTNKRFCVAGAGEGILIHLHCHIKVAWKKVVCYQNGWPPPAGMKTIRSRSKTCASAYLCSGLLWEFPGFSDYFQANYPLWKENQECMKEEHFYRLAFSSLQKFNDLRTQIQQPAHLRYVNDYWQEKLLWHGWVWSRKGAKGF